MSKLEKGDTWAGLEIMVRLRLRKSPLKSAIPRTAGIDGGAP